MIRRDRRGVYFAFQGLLAAVLLLLFLYQNRDSDRWVGRFALLVAASGGLLAFIQSARMETLQKSWVQAALFLTDAGLAALTLHWTNVRSDLYLVYFLIIYGTALTRSTRQSLIVAAVTSALYLAGGWSAKHGFPRDEGFWLRLNFLWVSSAMLAILSRDNRDATAEAEDKYRQRLIQIERLATLGQAAGEVAHRIKGPLTTIMVNSELLQHRFAKSPEALKELSQIQDEVSRCKQILKNLLDLGRIEEMDHEPVDARDPLRLALQSLEPRLRKQNISLDLAGLERPAPVIGDGPLLQEAFSAILQNAADALPGGGRLRVSLGARRFDRSREIVLIIEDDGKGIEGEDLEKIFQPFFTTKGAEGTGLGLSAALHILQKHGGSIDAHSDGAGLGARFTLVLPRAR